MPGRGRPHPDPYDDGVAQVQRARAVGEQAVASLRRSVSERLAVLVRTDPAWAEQAVDVGLVDRAWLESPSDQPFRTAPPAEMIQRFLERTAEQRPSVLASMGLNALEGLSLFRADPDELTRPTSLTVAFTDLEGFTRFTAVEGDEVAAALIVDHQRLVGPVVRSRGGRIVKRLGDGLMLTFPAPEAAVLASLEMVDAVTEPLRLRVGVHLGEAVATRDDLYGHIVNVAARITEEARGGQVLASTDVRDAVRPLAGVRFGRARKARLKGLDTMSLCRIESEVG
jgi:adenylate cyclase